MIDWLFVARHALWIAGAAIVLAAWSFGRGENLGSVGRAISRAGVLLFCIGFALTTPLWQALIWSVLAIFAAVETWRSLVWHRQHR